MFILCLIVNGFFVVFFFGFWRVFKVINESIDFVKFFCFCFKLEEFWFFLFMLYDLVVYDDILRRLFRLYIRFFVLLSIVL